MANSYVFYANKNGRPTGLPGFRGPKGEQGEQGEQGIQGEQGDPGVFIGSEEDMPAGTRVRLDPNGSPDIAAVINDNNVSTAETWSSSKISGELEDKQAFLTFDSNYVESGGNALIRFNKHGLSLQFYEKRFKSNADNQKICELPLKTTTSGFFSRTTFPLFKNGSVQVIATIDLQRTSEGNLYLTYHSDGTNYGQYHMGSFTLNIPIQEVT